jgi:hypothetical protein
MEVASWVRSFWPTPAVDRVRGAPVSGIVLACWCCMPTGSCRAGASCWSCGERTPRRERQCGPGGRLAATPGAPGGAAG